MLYVFSDSCLFKDTENLSTDPTSKSSCNLSCQCHLEKVSKSSIDISAKNQSQVPIPTQDDDFEIYWELRSIKYFVPGLKSIYDCPFYFGNINFHEANNVLANLPNGSYLLRDSSTKDFVFTMTFKHDSRIWHFRIKEKEHKFAFAYQVVMKSGSKCRVRVRFGSSSGYNL